MTDPVFVHPIPGGASAGMRFQLTGAEAKHTEVKRMRDGESLVVTDGSTHAIAGLWRTDGAAGEVEISTVLDITLPRPQVTVVQAIPKSDRAELAVDLMVQAGVDRIIPWQAARCVARWDGKEAKAKAKWENAARAAAKQSRRLRIPEVTDRLTNLSALPGLLAENNNVLVLHEESSHSFSAQNFDVEEIVLVVGPEGGVASEELDLLESLGAQRVILGPEVLRTATAATVALGAIGALTPRWG